VVIALPIIANDSLEVLCATYQSAPSTPSMLIAQECWNATTANDTLTAQSANMSQVFAYHPSTGVVQPLWNISNSTPLNCNDTMGPGGVPASAYTSVTAGDSATTGTTPPQVMLVFSEISKMNALVDPPANTNSTSSEVSSAPLPAANVSTTAPAPISSAAV
jgi:hypothetical protein